ncbi:DUF6167 family protein [Streptomyces sp. NPDC059506]|uniref:Secreted protein n=1 Tax=Streptomyces thermolineatus TaxID=44033 RepID=A0ABP5YM20_9ACTN|nr:MULTISPECIES: DUF6167 family protein [unclassified Streptomyces]MCZ2527064.1 DUF6167 family protein [Streptomyces sp. HB2AG]PLW71430.1 hypothetical protein C0036_17890 [Streptomyces sp. DJ]QMV24239.1 hypothetical protein GQS52_23450 [Streptomyces sp. SCUT-3]
MFRRAFWFSAGIGVGVWGTNKAHRALRRLQPESLAATAADKALEAGVRLRRFAEDVRLGMAEREDELNNALGLAPGKPELPAPGREPMYDRRNH